MIEPQRLGRFLENDSAGYVIPDVSGDLIHPSYLPLIEFVTQSLMNSGKVTSVYLRGSIPRGLAIPGISDADFIFLSEEPLTELEDQIRSEVEKKFPFVKGVEVGGDTLADFNRVFHSSQKRPYLQMLLKTQGLHLAGDDLTSSLSPFKPDIEMVSHVFILEKEFSRLPDKLKKASNLDALQSARKWFCRRVVRSGLEITLTKKPRFTRDLYLCYEQFAEFYPEYGDPMFAVLKNALNGDQDPLQYAKLIEFLTLQSQSLA